MISYGVCHTGGRELLDGGYKVPQVPFGAIEASDDDGIEPPPLCVGREWSRERAGGLWRR